MTAAVHFVGFRGDEYYRAMRVFGLPDFVHFHWDARAVADVTEEDTVVFAREKDYLRFIGALPKAPSYNDSEFF